MFNFLSDDFDLYKMSAGDHDLMLSTFNKFNKAAESLNNFYTTIFYHEYNRKICLYYSYGKLEKVIFNKLDSKRA